MAGQPVDLSIDPVFRLVSKDASVFEVRNDPGTETGAFELSEHTGGPGQRVTLDFGLLT